MEYPAVDVDPTEYERQIARHFAALAQEVENLEIEHGDTVQGVDGAYVIDTAIRYELFGASYLTLVECKLHRNPIKREDVQVLHSKIQSVGGHKGIFVSSSPYQRGALDFARTHGIALAQFMDGALLFGVKAGNVDPRKLVPLGSHGLALLRVEATDQGWSNTTLKNRPEYVREMLPGFA